jgi:hypothetical protein
VTLRTRSLLAAVRDRPLQGVPLAAPLVLLVAVVLGRRSDLEVRCVPHHLPLLAAPLETTLF